MWDFQESLEDYWDSYLRLLVTSILLISIIMISRKRSLNMERDLAFSSIRGFVQMILMASVILVIFEMDHLLVNILALTGMVVFASRVSANRSKGLPDNLVISFQSIFLGSSIILVIMVLSGALPVEAPYLIPLGGMVIGNSMNVTSLALDRLRTEVEGNRMQIEAYLALGSSWECSIRPIVRRSVRASLIPNIDSMNTLGLIWIPGLMAGMLIAGIEPYVAAVFQITIIAMIIGASLIAAVVSTHLMSKRLFTDALQLVEIL